jgi:cyclic pyranopterin phosphate synthase
LLPSKPIDQRKRPLRSLRVSVTDRCNLRCLYCMPEPDYVWLPREDLLTFEEISRLVALFTRVGVDRVRLTGGEPLLRHDLPALVQLLSRDARLREIALTTNGALLADQAPALARAGLSRVTVSLDTLRRDRFREFARRDQLSDVLGGIEEVRRLSLRDLKLDSVIMRGVNDDEIPDLVRFGEEVGAEVRFIEYMDVGGATRWSETNVFTKEDMLASLRAAFGGPIEPIEPESWAPAKRFRLPSGTVVGIIASTTEPFCRTCDRSRLTADGLWYLCLYAAKGHDLKTPLRAGASDEEILARLASTWSARDDRGAEQRLELAERRALLEADRLRKDPHLEMHTRGG